MNTLIALAWLPALCFVFVFPKPGLWRNAAARSSYILGVVIFAVMTLVGTRRLLDLHLPLWVVAAVYLAIAAALWFQLITLVVARRRNRPTRSPET